MIITKEQQEAVFNKYVKQKKNIDQCDGFIDGMNAAIKLVSQIEERSRKELTKQDNQ